MRLIDVDFVYGQIEKEKKDIVIPDPYSKCKNSEYDIGYNNALTMAKSIAKKAPTIEAEPVRHRAWVIKTHDYGYGEFKFKHCPDCDAGLPPEFEANYCYWCGAKMDGGIK